MTKASEEVNCLAFDSGYCVHHQAPERFFGKPRCILKVPISDPRVPRGCALQYKVTTSGFVTYPVRKSK
jgi:hypothetical protein